MDIQSQITFPGKKFFLHLRSLEEQTTETIRQLGGEIVNFLENDVDYVISDHPTAGKLIDQKQKKRVNCSASTESTGEGESATCSSRDNQPRKTVVPRTRTAAALQKKGVKGPSDEENGKHKIQSVLLHAIEKTRATIIRYADFAKLTSTQQQSTKPKGSKGPSKKCPSTGLGKNKVFRLVEPFIKLEDRAKKYRPYFEALERYPKINFDPNRRGCIFAVSDDSKAKAKGPKSSSSGPAGSPKRKRKAARKLNFDQTNTATRNTDSDGLALTIESKRYGDNRETRPGLCELCGIHADNMVEHLAGEIHRKTINSDIYKSLDAEIARGPTLNEFIAQEIARHTAECLSENRGSPRPSPRRQGARQFDAYSGSPSTASPSPSRPSVSLQSPRRSVLSPIRPPAMQPAIISQSPHSLPQNPARTPQKFVRGVFTGFSDKSPVINFKRSFRRSTMTTTPVKEN